MANTFEIELSETPGFINVIETYDDGSKFIQKKNIELELKDLKVQRTDLENNLNILNQKINLIEELAQS